MYPSTRRSVPSRASCPRAMLRNERFRPSPARQPWAPRAWLAAPEPFAAASPPRLSRQPNSRGPPREGKSRPAAPRLVASASFRAHLAGCHVDLVFAALLIRDVQRILGLRFLHRLDENILHVGLELFLVLDVVDLEDPQFSAALCVHSRDVAAILAQASLPAPMNDFIARISHGHGFNFGRTDSFCLQHV